MRTLAASIVFIGLLAALGVYAINHAPAKIQGAIKADIEYHYAQNDIGGIEVEVSGRDVTLLGRADSQGQLDSAIEIARHRPGVRVVMIEASVGSAPKRAFVEPLPDTFETLPETDSETE